MWDKIVYIFITIILSFIFKDKLYKTAKYLEYYYKFSILCIPIIICITILMPILIWNGRNVKNGLFVSERVKRFTKLLGVKWHIRNPEIASEERAAIIVINHQSALDIIGMFSLWHAWPKTSLVVKKEFIYYLSFGLCLYLMDTIFVDRANPEESYEVLRTKSKTTFQNKAKILFFPEGKRNYDFTKLLPFKKGAFNLAIENQVPIIPVVISRYYFINHKKHIFNNGNVIAQCLEPVSTEGLTMDDVPELVNRVQSNMEKAYTELSNELINTLPPDYPLAMQD